LGAKPDSHFSLNVVEALASETEGLEIKTFPCSDGVGNSKHCEINMFGEGNCDPMTDEEPCTSGDPTGTGSTDLCLTQGHDYSSTWSADTKSCLRCNATIPLTEEEKQTACSHTSYTTSSSFIICNSCGKIGIINSYGVPTWN
jgi:hypothetical protein